MENKRREKTKRTLSSTQEVLYQKEFKRADHAAGYIEKKANR
ncbi:YfhE family protein [Bacillaceae bacterium Marseille-Q3522]|nr:YfhE family protein [Bacillaceae bacterium Marseille-Q3522]